MYVYIYMYKAEGCDSAFFGLPGMVFEARLCFLSRNDGLISRLRFCRILGASGFSK